MINSDEFLHLLCSFTDSALNKDLVDSDCVVSLRAYMFMADNLRLFRQSVAEVKRASRYSVYDSKNSYEKPKELLLCTLDIGNIPTSFFTLMPRQIHY